MSESKPKQKSKSKSKSTASKPAKAATRPSPGSIVRARTKSPAVSKSTKTGKAHKRSCSVSKLLKKGADGVRQPTTWNRFVSEHYKLPYNYYRYDKEMDRRSAHSAAMQQLSHDYDRIHGGKDRKAEHKATMKKVVADYDPNAKSKPKPKPKAKAKPKTKAN